MVSGYMVTKAIAGGIMLMAVLMILLGHSDDQAAVGVVPPMVAGVFLAITGALLIGDLKQPGRFLYLLTRSNFSSWLVKGAYVLGAFAAVCGLWWIFGLADAAGALEVLAVPAAVLGAATAGYTAFLFAQCEGRDLWQTPLLLPLLLARAVVAGASAMAVLDLFMDIPSPHAVWWSMLGGLVAIAFLTWVELTSHGSRHVELAVASMTSGAQKTWFRAGAAIGVLAPTVLVVIALAVGTDNPVLVAIAAVFALVGMWLSETAFVRAGQAVPLS
jgi:formate-dependent nitrite reductase membrane component NrfD